MQSENQSFIKSWVAAIIVCALILFANCMLVGCKAAEPVVKVEERTVYRDRVEYVKTPADSSTIVALLECSEEGEVLLSTLDEQLARNDRLQFSLDSLGRMKAKVVHQVDSIPVTHHDTITNYVFTAGRTIEVEKRLTWWQQLRLTVGDIALCAALIALVIVGVKKLR